jgi:hypothetical protein
MASFTGDGTTKPARENLGGFNRETSQVGITLAGSPGQLVVIPSAGSGGVSSTSGVFRRRVLNSSPGSRCEPGT